MEILARRHYEQNLKNGSGRKIDPRCQKRNQEKKRWFGRLITGGHDHAHPLTVALQPSGILKGQKRSQKGHF